MVHICPSTSLFMCYSPCVCACTHTYKRTHIHTYRVSDKTLNKRLSFLQSKQPLIGYTAWKLLFFELMEKLVFTIASFNWKIVVS